MTRHTPGRERSLAIGMRMADRVFARRGNHSEAHIGRDELAALLTCAAELGHEESGALDLLEALRAVLPYAESRIEDIADCEDDRLGAEELRQRARAAYEAAIAAIAKVEGGAHAAG